MCRPINKLMCSKSDSYAFPTHESHQNNPKKKTFFGVCATEFKGHDELAVHVTQTSDKQQGNGQGLM